MAAHLEHVHLKLTAKVNKNEVVAWPYIIYLVMVSFSLRLSLRVTFMVTAGDMVKLKRIYQGQCHG